MPLVLTNEGLPILLSLLLKDAAVPVSPWVLMLWSNDIGIDPDTVLADLVPATFAGYFPVVVDRSSWAAPLAAGGQANTRWGAAMYEWPCTGGDQEIFGYAVFDSLTFKTLWVERFGASRVAVTGEDFGLWLAFTMGELCDD